MLASITVQCLGYQNYNSENSDTPLVVLIYETNVKLFDEDNQVSHRT